MNAISNLNLKKSTWQTAILLTLGFWLSASLVLDWVIMPSLAVAGMMNEENFLQSVMWFLGILIA